MLGALLFGLFVACVFLLGLQVFCVAIVLAVFHGI